MTAKATVNWFVRIDPEVAQAKDELALELLISKPALDEALWATRDEKALREYLAGKGSG